jgi:phosphoenolpyruvate synthase/pyruvate phosphate dikinase
MEAESAKYDRFSEEYISDEENHRDKAKVFLWYLKGEVIHGRAASLGVTTGRAVVIINDEDMLKVKDGVVIISRTASPGLELVLARANAIATENGGQSATVMGAARAYGIPAVTGIPGLMEKINDGDIVKVDGTNGIIEIRKCIILRQLK